MAMFCTQCGSEIQEGVSFCTECGCKIGAAVATAPESPAQQTHPVQAPPVKQGGQRSSAPLRQAADIDPESKVVSTGAYFGLQLLFALPVIGLISCIIMCAAPKNENIKHFARATLIWTVIGFLLAGVLVAMVALLGKSLMDYMGEFTGGGLTGFGA